MKYVYKYDVSIEDHFELELPLDARILSVQMQRGTLKLWALVDPTMPLETRKFRTAGTGHPIDEVMGEHISTFQVDGGNFIFHVFEVGRE